MLFLSSVFWSLVKIITYQGLARIRDCRRCYGIETSRDLVPTYALRLAVLATLNIGSNTTHGFCGRIYRLAISVVCLAKIIIEIELIMVSVIKISILIHLLV